MLKIHNLGFPRMGANRELKFALESYWRGELAETELNAVAKALRQQHWQWQANNGLDYIPTGDFSLYDQMLDTSLMLGVVPERFGTQANPADSATYFRMARGQTHDGIPYRACDMTKWFDTNYHFIVPEITADQCFRLSTTKLFDETAELQALGYTPKPVLIGPLTWLWLAKAPVEADKPALLDKLLPVYGEILRKLAEQGVEWVQLDEPILVLDLPLAWRTAFENAYNRLQSRSIKILLATYFGDLGINRQLACQLPVAGLHIDLVRAPEQLTGILDNFAPHKILSLGLVDGRNIWRGDLHAALKTIAAAKQRFNGELWLAPSCSLLHVPVDVELESALPADIKSWLAFAKQKLAELEVLRLAVEEGVAAAEPELALSKAAVESRRNSAKIHNPAVNARLENISDGMSQRHSVFNARWQAQQSKLNLPAFPTTTIGSFPQTKAIRGIRQQFKQGAVSVDSYEQFLRGQIAECVQIQEELGLDVLVHGEVERNDMVEYFGEQLDGFMFTAHGWVQSYGSRCVKPPVIYGDVSRPKPMTVDWISYAQSLTAKPMKGMLTGPVTILNWSFVRDDQPRSATAYQIALALRDEVADLEQAGIGIIQIDEPAFREGLPLKAAQWAEYLDWAVRAFRLSACGVQDSTQIHTHMCYSEFNDIIKAIADLDADVITIETSRSNMALLDAFVDFNYPNGIGPGVYDIHSPNTPDMINMVKLLQQAAALIPASQLWVNPDCGLKTRQWHEVKPALGRMVEAAKLLRIGLC